MLLPKQKNNLIPNGWDSFEPYGNEGEETRAPLEVFEEGYNRNYLLNSDETVYFGDVGGRNLILNSSLDGTPFRYDHVNKSGEGGLRILSELGFSKLPKQPHTYTISMNVRGISDANIVLYRISAEGNSAITFVKKSELSESFKKVSLTFIPHKDELTDLYIYTAYSATNYSAWFEIEPNSLKLEKGNTPTDWTPAPEDFEEQDIVPTTVGEYLPNEVGRNLIGTFNMTPGLWISAQGDAQLGSLVRIGSDFIEISGDDYYTLKYDGTNYDGSSFNKVVAFYDDLKIFIERKVFTDTDEVSIFKTPLNARYLRLAYATSPVTNPQAIYDNFAKLEKGNTPTDWSPAPEDFNNLKGKSYALSQPLRKENILSLNGSFEEDDFIGLWLGNDKFVGFLDNKELTFDLTENYDDEFLVVKTLSEKGIVDNAKIEKGNIATDWTPAWEDIPEEDKPVRAWDNMAVHFTPLGNGLTRIQTWGGNSDTKLRFEKPFDNEYLTFSTYLENVGEEPLGIKSFDNNTEYYEQDFKGMVEQYGKG